MVTHNEVQQEHQDIQPLFPPFVKTIPTIRYFLLHPSLPSKLNKETTLLYYPLMGFLSTTDNAHISVRFWGEKKKGGELKALFCIQMLKAELVILVEHQRTTELSLHIKISCRTMH